MHLYTKASKLSGSLKIPPSKSHTLRALLFASLAQGKSLITQALQSPDTTAMIRACRLLGAEIKMNDEHIEVTGVNGKPKTPADIIDCGNSGQVLRFVGSVCALCNSYSVLTGDHSIKTNRPVKPLIDALRPLGVHIQSLAQNNHAPLMIKGPLQPGHTSLNGWDSQPVSGLLIATAFADGATEIFVDEPGEIPWIDVTLNWFDRLGIKYKNNSYTHYVVQGYSRINSFNYHVPGDFSSAAYSIVAALVTQSEIILSNVDMSDIQGDKYLIYVLIDMGAHIEINEKEKTIFVKKSPSLNGININVNGFIDAVTILAVVGCFASGTTTLTGAAIARTKESDRLQAMACELNKMGADISVTHDGLVIHYSPLTGTTVDSHNDHRVALSPAVAGFAAWGETKITNTECIQKSYPNFVADFKKISAIVN